MSIFLELSTLRLCIFQRTTAQCYRNPRVQTFAFFQQEPMRKNRTIKVNTNALKMFQYHDQYIHRRRWEEKKKMSKYSMKIYTEPVSDQYNSFSFLLIELRARSEFNF